MTQVAPKINWGSVIGTPLSKPNSLKIMWDMEAGIASTQTMLAAIGIDKAEELKKMQKESKLIVGVDKANGPSWTSTLVSGWGPKWSKLSAGQFFVHNLQDHSLNTQKAKQGNWVFQEEHGRPEWTYTGLERLQFKLFQFDSSHWFSNSLLHQHAFFAGKHRGTEVINTSVASRALVHMHNLVVSYLDVLTDEVKKVLFPSDAAKLKKDLLPLPPAMQTHSPRRRAVNPNPKRSKNATDQDTVADC